MRVLLFGIGGLPSLISFSWSILHSNIFEKKMSGSSLSNKEGRGALALTGDDLVLVQQAADWQTGHPVHDTSWEPRPFPM